MRIEKHYGTVKSTGRGCIVVFKTTEDAPPYNQCLVVYDNTLPSVYGNTVSKFVANDGQKHEHLEEAMHALGRMNTGENMLTALHKGGYLKPEQIDNIDMNVASGVTIPLRELLEQLEELKKEDSKKELEKEMGKSTTIIQRTYNDAIGHYEQYKTKMAKAIELDPTLQDPFSVCSDVTKVEEPVQESNSNGKLMLHIELPEGISQTKAIEIFKDEFKKRKESDNK